MSNMIQCDGCKKTMYADSRSDKGDYHFLCIDMNNCYHLCRNCYAELMRDVLHHQWDDDEQQWKENQP